MKKIFFISFALISVTHLSASNIMQEVEREGNKSFNAMMNEQIHEREANLPISEVANSHLHSAEAREIRQKLIDDIKENQMDLIRSRWGWRRAANICKGLANVCLAGNVFCSSLALSIGSLGSGYTDTSKGLQIASSAFLASYAGLRLMSKYAAIESKDREKLLQVIANRIDFNIDSLQPEADVTQ